jgi:hypothetical protein
MRFAFQKGYNMRVDLMIEKRKGKGRRTTTKTTIDN